MQLVSLPCDKDRTDATLWRFTGYNMTSKSRDSPLTFHRVIEAFKFGYSWRSLLGDPAFNDGMNEVIDFDDFISSFTP